MAQAEEYAKQPEGNYAERDSMILSDEDDQLLAAGSKKELEYSDFMNAFKRHSGIINKAFISNILDYIVVPAIMFSLIVRNSYSGKF